MNITVTKIKRELKKNHGWDNLDNEEQKWFVDGLIKDTLAIVYEQLRKHECDTSLMYLSELEELPNNIIIKIGNKEFNFNSEYQSKWIKIESEKDLPKEKGLKCLFLCIHGNTTYISDDVLEDPKWFVNKYSHWRLKDEIKDPNILT